MERQRVRNYLLVSGVIFGLVALVHLFRVIKNLAFQFGPIDVPIWASWLGFLIPAMLCGWAFSLARK